MTHLYVSVRLHGTVVDERILPLHDGLRLGEAPDAAIPFPGADLILRMVDGKLWVRGRALGVGDRLDMSLGAVDLVVEVLDRAFGWTWLARRLENALGTWPTLPDARVLLATVALALAAASVDAMTDFVTADPVASAEVQALHDALVPTSGPQRSARIEAPDQSERAPAAPASRPARPEPASRDYEVPPVVFQRLP